MPHASAHSFIILAYKESPYLENCIDSLKKQTVKSDIRLSTSTPSPFLEEISKKHDIPIMINKKGGGIAADWTWAFQNSTTDYVTLAHQDDLYLPDYTEKCLKSAARYRNCVMLFTDYMEISQGRIRDNNLLLSVKRLILSTFYVFKNNLSSKTLKKMMLSLGNPICCPSLMYNRKKMGDFTFNESFSMNLDWEASFRLSERGGDFVYIKDKLMIRRIHKGSESTRALADKTRQAEDRKLFEKFWPKPIAGLILKVYSLAYRLNA